ncbi:MAG: methylaspartate ammonia-lyase [Oscillospiraceae bacterium]|nr:methylaspartate ammonia-lyase [Oscillospiraceae bacterium]
MKIVKAICAPGRTGFYYDDQRAIKQGAIADGATYLGDPTTPHFTAIRQAGEAISVMLILEDGQIAFGDCATVQYAGVGGRDTLFSAADGIPLIEQHVFPRLIGAEADCFRRLADELEDIRVDGKPLHAAIRYGVSQAILDAVAKAKRLLMCEVIAAEYDLSLTGGEIPIFTQSGDARYQGADKMILKGVPALPHALINHVETKLGTSGELLLDYVIWLRDRILALKTDDSYHPTLHIDVYGTIGQIFGKENYAAMAYYLETLAKAALPFPLRIEGPMDADERELQIQCMSALTRLLDERGIPVELVADEWCNTLEDVKAFANRRAGHMVQIKTPDLGGIGNSVEAVLYCKALGISAYLGGSCNETDRTAQVSVHLAMATRPDLMLAKPGMGVDEAYMIVYNEMQRIRAFLAAKHAN